MSTRMAVLIPVYGHYDYALRAIASALGTDDDLHVYVLDDASPGDPPAEFLAAVLEASPRANYWRAARNGGLTAMWNAGLAWAREQGHTYTVCGNSDLVFAPGWAAALRQAADRFDLCGPVTNAYGTEPGQDVRRYLRKYRPDDTPAALRATADTLAELPVGPQPQRSLNGFCLCARTERWWRGAYAPDAVFHPKHRMTFQEYELQRRWRATGAQFVVVPAAFVFHYRSVTRGVQRWAERQAYRPACDQHRR